MDLGRSVVGMAHPAHAEFEIKLLGMNGNLIKTFTFNELQWHTVGGLVASMENDNEPGVDGAQTDDQGRFMESFQLLDGVRRMHADRDVLDYFYRDIVTGDQPPAGPFRITFVKEPLSQPMRFQPTRRTYNTDYERVERYNKRRFAEMRGRSAAKRIKVAAA